MSNEEQAIWMAKLKRLLVEQGYYKEREHDQSWWLDLYEEGLTPEQAIEVAK